MGGLSRIVAIAFALAGAPAAVAQDSEETSASTAAAAVDAMEAEEDVFEEIIVYGDLFARWDKTRWFIATELGVPGSLTLQKSANNEFNADSLQIRTVVQCDKQW